MILICDFSAEIQKHIHSLHYELGDYPPHNGKVPVTRPIKTLTHRTTLYGRPLWVYSWNYTPTHNLTNPENI